MKPIAHSLSTHKRKRSTRVKRQYYGEDKAFPLVAWLNSSGEPEASNDDAVQASKTQITQILDWLDELGTARTDEMERCAGLTARINKLFAACPIIPYVWLVSGREMAAALDLAPAPGSAHEKELQLREAGRSYLPFGGHYHLMLLVDLWRAGLIQKITRCKQCRKWLFTRFEHKKFCSVECRDADKSTPGYKALRAKQVRDRRGEELARDRRNRERNRRRK
jgi:hypothetical protein